MLNNVVLIGRLVRDPDLRYLQGGSAVAKITLAVDKGLSREKKQELQSKNQPTADFIDVSVWGKPAENVANYLTKGKLVAVQGSIQTKSWVAQDGTKRYATDVLARSVQFLEWSDSPSRKDGSQDFHVEDDSDIPF